MKMGKKNLAQRIVYGAFAKVSEKLEKGDPVDLLLGRAGKRPAPPRGEEPPGRRRHLPGAGRNFV